MSVDNEVGYVPLAENRCGVLVSGDRRTRRRPAVAKLVFRHEGDKYFLAEIVGAEEVYTVGPDVRHQRPVDLDAAVSVATP